MKHHGTWNTQDVTLHMQYSIPNTQYAIRNTQYAIRNTQYARRVIFIVAEMMTNAALLIHATKYVIV